MYFVARRLRKRRRKIKTKNEKIVETDMDIWYYTYRKTIDSVRKKGCNVSSVSFKRENSESALFGFSLEWLF